MLNLSLAGLSTARDAKKPSIAITLNRAGRVLTSPRHALHVLLVLTVRDNSGQVSTLAYPVSVRRRG